MNVTFHGQTLEHYGSWILDGEFNIYGDVNNRTYWTGGGGGSAIWWTSTSWWFGNMGELGLYRGFIYGNTPGANCPYDNTNEWAVLFDEKWNTVPNSDVEIQCLPGWV